MGRKATLYQFESCQCMGAGGRHQWIPEGQWLVSDLGNVVVLVNNRRIELQRAAFQALKDTKKAVRSGN